jgi:heme/copper-type cytochrome/quinol oxidase subunit 2
MIFTIIYSGRLYALAPLTTPRAEGKYAVQRVLWLLQIVFLCITGSATLAAAADAPPQLALTLDQHRFTPEELRVKANTPFILILTNKDKEDEEFEIAALRIEQIVAGGKTLPLKMPALKPGTYEFVGEFHEKTAKGRIVAE